MMDAQQGKLRFGVVSSYDGSSGAAKVLLQPENVLSGWLPVLSQSVGPGWGLHVPLSLGDQVAVLPQEGDANHGVIIGRCFSIEAQPPTAAGADVVLRSSAGASVVLLTNGEVKVQDASGTSLTMMNNGTVLVTGTLMVTGDIIDANGAHNSLATLRAAYDAHHHPGVQTGGGSTGTTSNPVP